MRPLNKKQEIFARQYVIDHNATQAAIRAGYSKTSAYSQGHDLLKHPEVSALIAKLEANLASEMGITAHTVLQGIFDIADDSDSPTAARLKAWELLGKHLGLLVERVEHRGAQVIFHLGADISEEDLQ